MTEAEETLEAELLCAECGERRIVKGTAKQLAADLRNVDLKCDACGSERVILTAPGLGTQSGT